MAHQVFFEHYAPFKHQMISKHEFVCDIPKQGSSKETRAWFSAALFLPQLRLGQVDLKPRSHIFTRYATHTSHSRRSAA